MSHPKKFWLILILSVITTLLVAWQNEWSIAIWCSGGILGFIAAIIGFFICDNDLKGSSITFIIIAAIICLVNWLGFKVNTSIVYWIGLEAISFVMMILFIHAKCTYTHNKYMCDYFS